MHEYLGFSAGLDFESKILVGKRKGGFAEHWPVLSTASFRRPLGAQLTLL